jgi:hypothetical protein
MRVWRRALGAAVGLAVLGLAAVRAEEKAQKVGSVVEIDGPRLMTNRLLENSWFQAYATMPTYLSEKLKSDDKTSATLDFAIGGRAVISPGTEIEIVSQRGVDQVGNKVIVTAGKMWANIDKQQSQLQIKTSGGTMGIEGTEFVVEVAQDGDTSLSMIDGVIAVSSADGTTQRIRAGERALFGRRGLRRSQLAREIRDALASGHRDSARELLLEQVGLPAGARGAIRYAATHKRGVRRIKMAETAYLQRLKLRSRRAHGLRHPRRPVSTRTVAGLAARGSPPTFSWSPVSGAEEYAVVLSSDPQGDDPLWAARTASPRAAFPDYGPDLVAGQTYYWGVQPLAPGGLPLLADGEETGDSSSFQAQGHVWRPLEVGGLEVETLASKPRFRWTPVPGARSYQVIVASDAALQNRVWSDQAGGPPYTFPETARGLAAGAYYARLDALDEFGVPMGSSRVLFFNTAGWTSAGLAAP